MGGQQDAKLTPGAQRCACRIARRCCCNSRNLDIVYLDESRKYLRFVRVYRNTDGGWKLISSRTVNAEDREPRSG